MSVSSALLFVASSAAVMGASCARAMSTKFKSTAMRSATGS
jgi:hypothetical protein